jgi:hypothetical protein
MDFFPLAGRDVADFSNKQERNWMPAYALTVQIVTTFLLWTRILNRFTTRGQVGFDDVMIFLAWILGTALTILVLLCTPSHSSFPLVRANKDPRSNLQIWIQ